MKKKVAFMAPQTKWWPYFIYKDLVNWLKEKYWKELDVYLFNSKSDWLKLHFLKFDVIFSVIPFLFKPLWAKKFIFNLHGNFEIEKKKPSLWNKLLYLARWNLKFADKIMLTSYFLADKLDFKEKYQDKIIIVPNFINPKDYNFWEKIFDESKYKILTITSFKFYDKGKWILNLWKVISTLWQKTKKPIIWTIVWNDNSENFKKIKKEFDKIIFPDNVKIVWKWWINKEDIKKELKNNDYFLYWTCLDNFPTVIIEALASKMKVLVNNFESFKYFLPKDIICNSENEMVEKMLRDDIFINSNLEFDKGTVLNKIYNSLKENV